jgi:hypothetical protein
MKRLFAGLMLSALLVGCANVPRQAFNKEANPNIKSLAVTQHTKDEEFGVIIVAHPGGSFGLIGAVVAAADMNAKAQKLTQALDPKKTRVQQQLSSQLAASLAKAGYSAQVVTLDEALKDDAALLPVVRSKASTDAVLAVGVSAQYVAAGPSSDYFPYVVAKVKTLDAKSGSVLYEDTISYGYTFQQTQAVHLPSDTRFRFKTIDDLVANADRAREGLMAGVDAIVAQVTSDLKR